MNAKSLEADELLAHGKQVLDLELSGLSQLKDQLGASFIATVNLLLACQGRVIVTGMGKSGHIARKITATFASTGTPSVFVHPAEAGHGDLGMITENDLIIAISNGGESSELESILLYAKRNAISVIAITANANSTLGTNATEVLLTPKAKEACPFDLAPTTSTTVTLALGDALAVALMHARGFTPNDFGRFHPGGKLGAQLRTAQEVVDQNRHPIPLVPQNASMREVLVVMNDKRLGCTGVIDENNTLVGVITDGDLRRGLEDKDLLEKSASDLMGGAPITAHPDMLAVEVLNLIEDKRITAVFVVEDGLPKGIIHLHDLLASKAA